MPAIDFPASPTLNQEYSFEGRTWLWNGTGWEVKEYPAALLAGTAANPSLYFSGDPNTGIYSPGADQVAISTGGAEQLRITSAGLVGIGTISPSTELQVVGTVTATTFAGALTGAASSNVLKAGDTMTGNLTLNAQSDLRFADADSSHFIALQAPAIIASSVTLTLPAADGTADQVLATNGAGVLSFVTPAGGGGSSTLTINAKTSAYSVVAGDLGEIINCTSGTFTVSLAAAATLGAGFNCWIWNTSATATDAITIDPNASETIDGRTTRILRPGEGLQIVCDGTNFQTGDKKTMRGYAENISVGQNPPTASGILSIAIGADTIASADQGLALGYNAQATSLNGAAIGSNSGSNGSRVNTGAGAMALGGSHASGTDSFAAAIANNTSTYGAQSAQGIAIGDRAKAGTAGQAIAIGGFSVASGTSSVAIGGYLAAASGASSIAIGLYTQATAANSTAFGYGSVANIKGKYAYAGGQAFATSGGAGQKGLLVPYVATTGSAATVLTSNGGAASTDNQVILPNNSAYAFHGTIVARRQASGGTASAAWKIEGLIRREGTAASTTLVASTVTAISNVPGWTLTLSADTTNGGLNIEATGAAATNIRWVATVYTSEVTYA